MDHKTILQNANAAISEGKHEEFLSYFTENTKWNFTGDQILNGKDEVRKYIADAYKKPPQFDVKLMVSEENYVVVTGQISLWESEAWKSYEYCDVWKFTDGKMDELTAFVIPKKSEK